MLDNHKLVLDTFCEVYDMLKPYRDGEFWDFAQVQDNIIPGAIYVIGRRQFLDYPDRIQEIAESGIATIIFSNPHEGSWTIVGQCTRLDITRQVLAGKILIIGGGDMSPEYQCLRYDSFLPKVLDYEENLQAQAEYARQWTSNRPYKFLFLNGRGRPHRQQLLQHLQPLLDQAIWTNLDSAAGPVKILGPEYEFDFYRDKTTVTNEGYVKYELFNDQWGEIYLRADPYLATHFSLVTETVFEYPYSFRTEKIAKPLAIGHPFIAVSNAGYYRDLHNLGFRTWGNLIDESFDTIDDNDQRLKRIAQVVEDLCQQDLAKFSEEAYNVCKYNQQHLAEIRLQIRKEFPERFRKFINERS